MRTRRFVRLRRAAGTAPAALALTALTTAAPVLAPAFPASAAASHRAGATAPAVPTAPAAFSAPAFDPAKLTATLDAVHAAGMYGIYSAVRDGDRTWQGASGVADVRTGRRVTPEMEHRVGSVTKTFVATALMQQVERGRLRLDAPIGGYLPDLVAGQRGEQITVRMILNHTSGIGDYVSYAFPSLLDPSAKSLDEGRFRHLTPKQLVDWGLQAPPTGAPGENWSYSNTNYILAGQLLEKLTGAKAETYIRDNVIRRAGLKHTYFPKGPRIKGAHPRMYESLYGHVKPPRDYSTYDMSWAGTAGALVSTMPDLNRFYRRLLTGGLVSRASVAEMQRTVPVKDAEGTVQMNYGLGIYSMDLPCGTFWGHDGAVWGAGTQSLTSADGKRQVSFGFNLMKYQKLNGEGLPMPHPIDNAMAAHAVQALCGGSEAGATAKPQTPPTLMPLEFLSPNAQATTVPTN